MDVRDFKREYLGTATMNSFGGSTSTTASTTASSSDSNDFGIDLAEPELDEVYDYDYDYDDDDVLEIVDDTVDSGSATDSIDNATTTATEDTLEDTLLAESVQEISISSEHRVPAWQKELEGLPLVLKEFYKFFYENGREIEQEGELLSMCQVWNNAFHAKLDNDAFALLEFVANRFGIVADITVFSKVLIGKPIAFYKKVTCNRRPITMLDVVGLDGAYEQDWFDSDAYNRYSIEDRNSQMFLQVLQAGLFNKEEIVKVTEPINRDDLANISQTQMSKALDRYNAYLQLKVADKLNFNRLVNRPIESTDWNKFVRDEMNSEEVTLQKLLSERSDFEELQEVIPCLEGMISVEELEPLVGYYDLLSVLKGRVYGYPIGALMEECFKEKSEITEAAQHAVQEGKLALARADGRYHFATAKALSDLDTLGVVSQSFSHDPLAESLNSTLQKLVLHNFAGEVTDADYRKFIVFLDSNPDTIQRYAVGNYRSFYDFLFSVVLQEFGITRKVEGMLGDVVTIITEQEKVIHTSLMDCFHNLEEVRGVMPLLPCVRRFVAGTGIVIAPKRLEATTEKFLKNFNRYKSSLDRLEQYQESGAKSPWVTNYNLLVQRLQHEYAEVPSSLQSLDDGDAIRYDKVFSFLLEDGWDAVTMLWLEDTTINTLQRLNSLLKLGNVYSIVGNVLCRFAKEHATVSVKAIRKNLSFAEDGKVLLKQGSNYNKYSMAAFVKGFARLLSDRVSAGYGYLQIAVGINYLEVEF